MEQSKTPLKNIILLYVLSILVIVYVIILLKSEQNFNNKYENTFNSKYEMGSDEYIIDSITYIHPDWEYQQVEDYVFLSSDKYEIKYKLNK